MKRILIAIALSLVSTGAFAQTALTNYQPGPRLIDGSKLNLMVAAVNNLQGNGTAGAVVGTTGSFSSTLGVTGNFAVNTNKFTVTASSGNTLVAGTLTGTSFSGTGGLTAFSATATPAAASAPSVLTFGSAGINISFGTGTPSIAAPQGSIYIQTDGSSSSTRLFIRGSSTWIAVTTAS